MLVIESDKCNSNSSHQPDSQGGHRHHHHRCGYWGDESDRSSDDEKRIKSVIYSLPVIDYSSLVFSNLIILVAIEFDKLYLTLPSKDGWMNVV